MEIALGALTLGGLYILSNKDNKEDNDKEGFESRRYYHGERGSTLNYNDDPNQIVNENFPQEDTENDEYTSRQSILDDFRKDKSKFFIKNKELVAKMDFDSLTGEKKKYSEFEHNNMQPFFGSNVKQSTDKLNSNENVLDNMQGSGSQLFSKKENAPLFKPEDNVSWNHGMPNHSSFIQSRMNPSMHMNNTKPWEEIRVAPGLDAGYNGEGKGGFNSGVMSRDNWKPKDVNELRTENNPKQTYEGVVLGGKYYVNERGVMGKMEKNRPERAWEHNADRYFTTTGAQIKPTAQGEQMLGHSNRISTTREYFGGSNENNKSIYVKGEYKPSTRPELDPDVAHISNAYAGDKYDPTNGDHGIQGYNLLPNERSLTGERTQMGFVSTIAKEIVMPIQDFLRPSRKENVIGNLRPTGNAGTTVGGLQTGFTDSAKTTRKEMMVDNDFLFNVGNNVISGNGHTTNPHQPASTQRTTTGTTNYSGIAGPAVHDAARDYTADYNAILNENKEKVAVGRINTGNTNMFNNYENISIRKNDKKCNESLLPPARGVTFWGPDKNTHGNLTVGKFDVKNMACQRNTPDMVAQYNNNPYTHKIGSFA